MASSSEPAFNSDYYLAVATVMPILMVGLVIQTRSMGGRNVRYVLEGMREMSNSYFTAALNPINWIIAGPLLFGPAASFAAEGLSLVALNQRHVSQLNDLMITISITLAFASLFWAGLLLIFSESDEEGSAEGSDIS